MAEREPQAQTSAEATLEICLLDTLARRNCLQRERDKWCPDLASSIHSRVHDRYRLPTGREANDEG